MILPIIVIFISVAALVIITKPNNSKKPNEAAQHISAQDFINVRDIEEHVLYTRDDYCISYVRINPPMSSLWSKRERRMKTNTLVAEIAQDREPWIMTAVSRPMDISQLINQYQQMRDETDNPIRKNILRQEMNELKKKVGAGEAVERQFYLKIWGRNKEGIEAELLERARKIVSAYESIGITSMVIKKPDIIRYCNLVHNPAYINAEDTNTTPSFPMILDMEVEV